MNVRMVKVPAGMEPIFTQAEQTVAAYFGQRSEDPSRGTIEISGERYVLIRAAALSVEFFHLVETFFGDDRQAEADEFARNLLFDCAHAIGRADAQKFHAKMDLTTPVAKLAVGPVHFSRAGWSVVEVLPETRITPGEDCCLVYDHPHSFEADAWIQSGRRADFPVCVMGAGYSSGWAQQSFGLTLVASEILCRARGDDHCRFILAPPHRIDEHIARYVKRLAPGDSPGDDARIRPHLIPGLFARKRTEAALRESEARYRMFFEDSPISLWEEDFSEVKRFLDTLRAAGVTDVRGYLEDHPDQVERCAGLVRVTDVNKATLELFEAEGVGDLGDGLTAVVRDEAYDLFREELVSLAEGRGRFEGETTCRTLTGQTRRIHLRSSVLPGGEQTLSRLLVSIVDITGLKRAEQALADSEETQRALLNAATDSALLLDLDGRILVCNETAAARLGGNGRQLTGACVFDLMPPELARSRKAFVDGVVRTAQACRFEDTRDGRVFDSNLHPVCDANGKVTRIAVFARDITERKRAEEALRQAQKLEAVGKLAGGVAHDFNNLLTAILGYASLLRQETPHGSFMREAAEAIEEAGHRAARLTAQLLGFAQQGKHQVVPVDLHAMLTDVADMLTRTLDKSIRITLDLRAPRFTVTGDPDQVRQVLLNLALNASDAMPDGGELTFRTELAAGDRPSGRRASQAPTRASLAIAVIDTGSGIPPEIQNRVFEPFFTTQEQGKGTGMGLPMAYGIVTNHGGSIELDSQVGHGTTFTLYLPLADDAPCPSPPSDADHTGPPGVRVLLVDDEEVVRGASGAILRSVGHHVVTASSGPEAVEYYRTRHGEIDVVVIDMAMPGMDGHACFNALKQINPNVKAILSSGYGRDGRTQAALDDGVLHFVQKPYRQGQLDQAIRLALGDG